MTEKHAELVENGPILKVIFTREDKLNAISPQMTETLWAAARALATRDDLRALVITARGRYFTAGIDLAARPTSGAVGGQEFRRQYREHHLLYDGRNVERIANTHLVVSGEFGDRVGKFLDGPG
jgi:enoyl-CoA hydratase